MGVDTNESWRTICELLGEAQERATRFLESLPGRRVAAARSADGLVQALGGALPPMGRPASEILAQLDEIGSPGNGGKCRPSLFRICHGRCPAGVAGRELARGGVGPRRVQRDGPGTRGAVVGWGDAMGGGTRQRPASTPARGRNTAGMAGSGAGGEHGTGRPEPSRASNDQAGVPA